MTYRLISFPNGKMTLQHVRTGEAMHSSIGPWEEAHQVYIDQCCLGRRLLKNVNAPLVIYDLGLGIGTNAIAAINTALSLQSRHRKLHLISVEADVSGIKFALENLDSFPFLYPYRSALDCLIKDGNWAHESGRIEWRLLRANFQDFSGGDLSPELVFFDFYPPKADPHLWGYQSFKRLYEMCIHSLSPEPLLVTYSSATSVRSAMLLAGFHVGYGKSTVVKKETTVAALHRSTLNRPLDTRWIDRLMRSGKPFPEDLPKERRSTAIDEIQRALLHEA